MKSIHLEELYFLKTRAISQANIKYQIGHIEALAFCTIQQLGLISLII